MKRILIIFLNDRTRINVTVFIVISLTAIKELYTSSKTEQKILFNYYITIFILVLIQCVITIISIPKTPLSTRTTISMFFIPNSKSHLFSQNSY